MDTMTLLFVIDILCIVFCLLSLAYPFMSLIAVVISSLILVVNITSVTGIYLTMSVITIFFSAVMLALSVFRSGDYFD